LEQDDLMRPRRIEAQFKAVADMPDCGVVIGRFAILGNEEEDDMKPLWTVPQLYDLFDHLEDHDGYSLIDSKAAFKTLLVRNFAASNSNLCFAKSWWKRLGGFNEQIRTCVDLDFMLRVTMVRLRAASEKPEWAGEELEALRYSALVLARAALKKGDLTGIRAMAETFTRHKGLLTVKQTVNNKTRHMLELLTR
jgi:hypothetical protein